MSQAQEKTVEARITHISVTRTVFKRELAKRCQYNGIAPFTVPTEKLHSATNPDGLYESYTHFRQTVRDMIAAESGCPMGTARTNFISVKDELIEQCKADGFIEIKGIRYDMKGLSMERDLKPKKEKAPKKEAAPEEAPVEEVKADKGRWLVMDADGKEVGDFQSRAKANKAKEGNQKVVDGQAA